MGITPGKSMTSSRRRLFALPSLFAGQRWTDISIDRHTITVVLEGLLLMLGLWAALTLRLPGDYGQIAAGQPSPVTIHAPNNAVYTSEILTEARRAEAANSPDTLVFATNPQLLVDQRNELDRLLATIDAVRKDPSLDEEAKIRTLAELPNASLVLSDEQAQTLIAFNPTEWASVRVQSVNRYDQAVGQYNYVIDEQAFTRLRERSIPYWVSTTTMSQAQRDLVALFAGAFLRVNHQLDESATQARKQEARAAVPPQTVEVLAGENIVRQGEIVTPEALEALQVIGALPKILTWVAIMGFGLLALLLATGFIAYLLLYQETIARNTRSLLIVVVTIILAAVSARMLLSFTPQHPYYFPLATVALVFAVVFNGRLALASGLVISLTIGLMTGAPQGLATTLFFSCVVAVIMVRNTDKLLMFLLAGLGIALVVTATETAFWMAETSALRLNDFGTVIGPFALFGSLNGALSAILALGTFNIVGRASGVVTSLQLMELAHPSQPLLRKLIREAPGTYYHSVAVGNLAEAAAEAISADALLLRVAAYYHDIGKTMRPYFFTDNQLGRENVHNDLDPVTSAQIIVDHVREGVKMARAAGLPEPIVDFISTHHGTGLIKHFYQLALQEQDSVDIADFRYPGPRPRTREEGILMLADSVEATVRSKAQNGKLLQGRSSENGGSAGGNGAQGIDDLVASIFDARVREGELDEAPLTMRELVLIRQAFVTSLHSIYHPRVDYAPQVVK
jgi:hypothetical protein